MDLAARLEKTVEQWTVGRRSCLAATSVCPIDWGGVYDDFVCSFSHWVALFLLHWLLWFFHFGFIVAIVVRCCCCCNTCHCCCCRVVRFSSLFFTQFACSIRLFVAGVAVDWLSEIAAGDRSIEASSLCKSSNSNRKRCRAKEKESESRLTRNERKSERERLRAPEREREQK